MELLNDKYIMDAYNATLQQLTQTQVESCTKLLKSVVNTICNFITNHIQIHQEVYVSNETYKSFIDNISSNPDTQFQRIINMGNAQKGLNSIRNIRTFGLYSATKFIFGFGEKRVKQKYVDWLEQVNIILDSYNSHIECGTDFSAYIITVLTLKQIVLDAFEQNIYHQSNSF